MNGILLICAAFTGQLASAEILTAPYHQIELTFLQRKADGSLVRLAQPILSTMPGEQAQFRATKSDYRRADKDTDLNSDAEPSEIRNPVNKNQFPGSYACQVKIVNSNLEEATVELEIKQYHLVRAVKQGLMESGTVHSLRQRVSYGKRHTVVLSRDQKGRATHMVEFQIELPQHLSPRLPNAPREFEESEYLHPFYYERY